jgi:serine/threonine protein kinase
VEKIGSGGFGEVWKATAPGDLMKAIKIVYGDVDGPRAEQELRALRRIKEVRHPFLLSLERFEVLDGQLLIVTELAESSLQDRFNECRSAGHPGIPRDELLAHLRDAAEALDYMCATCGLQHLDIKPQNLLLMAGRIKIADFGLVKELAGTSVTATGGVTPLYATPEAFDGRVSRFSDQYSLAIVYQEMLTGLRPFPGTTTLQLAAQHTIGRPFLDPLPPQDRPIIARALSKAPEARFPTCREMIASLQGVRVSTPVLPVRGGQPTASLLAAPAPSPLPGLPTRPSSSQLLANERAVTQVSAGGSTPHLTGASTRIPAANRPDAEQAVPESADFGLRPTLFLGIGGLAAASLIRLKKRLHARLGDLADVPIYRFLLVDTDRTALRHQQLGLPSQTLAGDEALLAALHPPEHYRPESKSLLRWLDRRWLYGIPRSLQTEGLRPLGRLAFVGSSQAIHTRIKEALESMLRPETITAAQIATGQQLRTEVPRIYIISSITGGTGGGMLADMAYAVRRVQMELRFYQEGPFGILLYATGQKPSDRDLACINACATLTELQHFSRPDSSYPEDVDRGLISLGPGTPPFEECYLLTLGDQLTKAEAEAATDIIASYLDLDASPGGSSFLDEFRHSTRLPTGQAAAALSLRSFGASRISFPKEELINTATDLFCRGVVEAWPGTLNESDRKELERRVQSQAARLELAEEPLVSRLQAALQSKWGDDPNQYLLKLLSGVSSPSQPGAGQAESEISAELLLDRVEQELGTGQMGDSEDAQLLSPAEETMTREALNLAASLSRQTLEWLLKMVETPWNRIKAAGLAASQFTQHLQNVSQKTKERLARLQKRREAARSQLVHAEGSPASPGATWLRSGRPKDTIENIHRAMLEYARFRLMEISLENALLVLSAVRDQLSRINDHLVQSRSKLAEISKLFPIAPLSERPLEEESAPAPHVTELLPGQSPNLAAAAAALLSSLSPELIRQFDEKFQSEVLDQLGGLWGLVCEEGDPLRPTRQLIPSLRSFWEIDSDAENLNAVLRRELQNRARRIIAKPLEGHDAASLLLEAHTGADERRRALLTQVEAALPGLDVPCASYHIFMKLPRSEAGRSLRAVAQEALQGVPLTLLESEGDIVVYQETAGLSLEAAWRVVAGKEADCIELSRRVLTRTDINWSLLPMGPEAAPLTVDGSALVT